MGERDLCLYLMRGILMDHQRNILYYVCRTHTGDTPTEAEGEETCQLECSSYQQGTLLSSSVASPVIKVTRRPTQITQPFHSTGHDCFRQTRSLSLSLSPSVYTAVKRREDEDEL